MALTGLLWLNRGQIRHRSRPRVHHCRRGDSCSESVFVSFFEAFVERGELLLFLVLIVVKFHFDDVVWLIEASLFKILQNKSQVPFSKVHPIVMNHLNQLTVCKK